MLLDLDNPIRSNKQADLMRIYDPSVHGIIVNKTQTHWTAIRYVDEKIWLLDSQKEPEVLSWDAYVTYIKKYHNAFALCDTAEI